MSCETLGVVGMLEPTSFQNCDELHLFDLETPPDLNSSLNFRENPIYNSNKL